jgi:FkbH-like protein
MDLDNTLWGGVIGEDGLAGISLGAGPNGEAFVAFQEYLLQLKEKGIVLVVASKNNDADARRVFTEHPDMRIRLEDLAMFVCNWAEKPTNLRRISEELNLGLDALVLVDDNPAEGALVRQVLPQVDVITLPADPSHYVRAVSEYLRFETTALSREDIERTQMYRARAEAASLEASAGGLEDFYHSLRMKAAVAPFDEFHLPRIAQLTAKTNQFNLTTRRYRPEELRTLMQDRDSIHLYLRLQDRFADHGLVSVLMARVREQTAEIDAWLMSCRVIGRTVEAEMLTRLCRLAEPRNFTTIRGTYIPTGKNQLVEDVYRKFGFTLVDERDGSTIWEYDLVRQAPIRNGFIEEWLPADDGS